MKLDKLWIEDFKNLKDFSVNFDETSSVTVIIGWNGTGKSNLFEALAIIFRDLDLKRNTPFAYRLEYICHNSRVRIDHDPKRTGKERLIKQVIPLIQTLGQDKKSINGDTEHLPTHVFGYYSGPTTRLKRIFADHKRRYYDAILNVKTADPQKLRELRCLRRLFYAETYLSKFVLLAFFFKKDGKVTEFLEKYLRIVGLESVLFVMKKPDWAKTNEHLWGARGLVRNFLDRLYEISLAPMKLRQRVPTSIKRSKTEEFYYLFVRDIDALIDLASAYETQSDFFACLESTNLSEVIYDLQVKVKIRNYDGTLTLRELSEGEQQLLMVIGLLRFTKEKESLILLDEPDTHLNPFWSTEYLEILNQMVGGQENGNEETGQDDRHIIMSTHDPLVIAGLERKQVQIFKRDPETDRCYAEIPERSPRGMGYEGILTSDMFGFRSALDRPTLELLDRKRRLAIKDELTDQEKRDLARIDEELGSIDFSNVVRDEYYMMFIRHMAEFEQREGISGQLLTPEQMKLRKEYAKRIASRLSALKKGQAE
jgi:predicted ATPase